MTSVDPSSSTSPTLPKRLEVDGWEAPGGDADLVAEGAGITDRVPDRILRLWIDLVRQAEGRGLTPRHLSSDNLTEQEFGALDYLQGKWRTLTEMTSDLGISGLAVTSIANHLTKVGAAKRSYNSLDQGLMHLVSTAAGSEMSRDHRRSQVATLEWLLDQTETARRAVLVVAMKQLGRAPDLPDRFVLAQVAGHLTEPRSPLPNPSTDIPPSPPPELAGN